MTNRLTSLRWSPYREAHLVNERCDGGTSARTRPHTSIPAPGMKPIRVDSRSDSYAMGYLRLPLTHCIATLIQYGLARQMSSLRPTESEMGAATRTAAHRS